MCQHCGSIVCFFYCDRPGAGREVSFFCYSALFAKGFRAKARCVAKRFVVNFYLSFSVFVSVKRCASFFYCGASAGPPFCGRRLVYCSRLPTAAMAESQGQDSSLFSSQAVIRLSPCVLNNVQAVVVECGPGANSSTYIKEKVVAEASKDRASLSESPLPEEVPPPTVEVTPVGPNGDHPCLKESGGRSLPPFSQGAKRPKWLGVGVIRHWLPPLPPTKPVTVGGEAGARPGTWSPWSQTAVARTTMHPHAWSLLPRLRIRTRHPR